MKNKLRVLIAGCGYVGKALAAHLVGLDYSVYTLSRSEQHIDGANHICTDLNQIDPTLLPEVDIIFYLAAPDTRTEIAYELTYVKCLKNLLQHQDELNAKRLIFASSTVVYAENAGNWINELSTLRDDNFRARIMHKAEEVALELAPSPIIARISAIYGPNRHRLLDQVRAQQRFPANDPIYSNRIYITDLVYALEHLIHIQLGEQIYNITDQSPTPINTILSWLATKEGKQLPNAENLTEVDLNHLKNRKISCEKLLGSGFSHQFSSFKQGFNHIFKLEQAKRLLDY